LGEGDGNQVQFKSFVKKALSDLISIDEEQKPDQRKGYITAAAKISGYLDNSGGILGFFYNMSEEDRLKLKNLKKGLFRGVKKSARILGLYEAADDELDRNNEDLPYYDLESLSLDQLLQLAKEMRDSASAKVGRYRD
jgi:hypothetical protein